MAARRMLASQAGHSCVAWSLAPNFLASVPPTKVSQVAAQWFKKQPIGEAATVNSSATFEQIKDTHVKHGHVAFAGRSNVGKSSLLNALFNRKKSKSRLAATGKKPGKTRALHFFSVGSGDMGFAVVDMPGIGFAQAHTSNVQQWNELLGRYIRTCVPLPLRQLVYLVDCRRGLMDVDMQFLDFLADNEAPVMLCLTKLDKISPTKLQANIDAMRVSLETLHYPNLLPVMHGTSARTDLGLSRLRCSLAHTLGIVDPYDLTTAVSSSTGDTVTEAAKEEHKIQ